MAVSSLKWRPTGRSPFVLALLLVTVLGLSVRAATPSSADCVPGAAAPCDADADARVSRAVMTSRADDEVFSDAVPASAGAAVEQQSGVIGQDYRPIETPSTPATARVPETASLLVFGSALALLAAVTRRVKRAR